MSQVSYPIAPISSYNQWMWLSCTMLVTRTSEPTLTLVAHNIRFFETCSIHCEQLVPC